MDLFLNRQVQHIFNMQLQVFICHIVILLIMNNWILQKQNKLLKRFNKLNIYQLLTISLRLLIKNPI